MTEEEKQAAIDAEAAKIVERRKAETARRDALAKATAAQNARRQADRDKREIQRAASAKADEIMAKEAR